MHASINQSKTALNFELTYLQQVYHADEVVLVVQQRELHRLSNRFHCRKMDHRHDPVVVENLRQICDVEEVAFVESHLFPSNSLDTLKSHGLVLVIRYRVCKVVKSDDVISSLKNKFCEQRIDANFSIPSSSVTMQCDPIYPEAPVTRTLSLDMTLY